METTYRKTKGNAGLEGVQFQLNLLTVFLLNALRSRKNWKISTENQNAGKFDDLVLELPHKSILLQAKFKQSKKISKYQLFSCNSKNADFSLPKYFFSYLEVQSASVEKTVIVCTNTNIDERGLGNFLTRHVVEPDSMLHYEGAIYPYFTFNENILPDLKASAETYLDANLRGKGINKATITHENLMDFLNHFQFFSNYPSGEKLDTIIGQLLFRLNDSSLYRKVSSQEIFKKLEDWFKQPKGEYLTELRAKAMFSEIKSEKYCEELKNYNVSFRAECFDFADPKRIFYINAEGRRLLQALRIYDVLRKKETRKLYVNPDDDDEVQKRAIEAFRLPRYSFLIIIGVKIAEEIALKEMSEQLKEVLMTYAYKKVILVAEPDDKLSQEIGVHDILNTDGSVTFNDLSQECQHRLAEEKNIIFQGERVSLGELLVTHSRKDWARAIHSEILEELIKKKEIKVGVSLTPNKPASRYYVHRTFKRQACNIHTRKESREDTFPEGDIYDVNDDVVLISDSAGMGKSTVLSKLATAIKEKNPQLWVIKIALTEYTNILRDIKNSGVSISVTKLLNSKKATRLTNHLERCVFFTRSAPIIRS